MLKQTLFIICVLIYNASGQELIIQENEAGFCYLDGTIDNSAANYTGTGYANVDPGVGASISWSVSAAEAGIYFVKWRYTVAGTTERPGRLLVNSEVAYDTVYFPITGTGGDGWSNWMETDSIPINLRSASNQIRLEAYSSSGLGNYDYISILGEGLSPGNCIPSFTLIVKGNIENAGSITTDPVQEYYDIGTTITLTAHSNAGYFFQSWSGDETGTDSVLTFTIDKNTEIEAIFLPDGTEMDSNIKGYATVQDDVGTPYLVIGGALGDTVEAGSFDALQTYLSSPQPYIVILSQEIIGDQNVSVGSNKTLLGLDENAHLQGIGLEISQARNVIVKNVRISKVTPQDAIEVNGSLNIWIDHCELFSDTDHGPDYYDGLLDIKNASSFITVSWCVFHDHYKTSLISSGDQAVEDTVTRVTYHHNYFYNCESRLPSIRFGKAHIFNNYYKDCNTAINTRMGACVRVEKNYFNNVNTAVMAAYSTEQGNVELIDNHFGTSNYITSPTCSLDVPYEYQSVLDDVSEIPSIVAGDIASLKENIRQPEEFKFFNYPNPFNPETKVVYYLPDVQDVQIEVFNILGQKITILEKGNKKAGMHSLKWNIKNDHLSGGIYYLRLKTGKFVKSIKVLYLP